MDGNMLPLMLQSIAGLAVVLAIFAAIVWLLKRLQNLSPHADGSRLAVERRIPIDGKNALVEISYRGSHYLLAVTPTGIEQIRLGEGMQAGVGQQEASDAQQ